MDNRLSGMKIAILATDGFEQSELMKPREALKGAGAQTVVVSPHDGEVRGWNKKDWGDSVPVDMILSRANPAEFDALLLPGGVINPDHLRMDPNAVAFVKAFFEADKPVAAICHGPWTVIDAGFAKGRRMTSWPSLKTDLTNAGANWVDEESVTDGNLVTARKPDDIPAFNTAMLTLFGEKGAQAKMAM
ncbi:MAG TPA: type 1 glutamine amidotransferase domain-containing protein [Alphaproteobacteria bacterium]|nr:type 1 glutamine amidotransferase domain-containing protein [Alphaproteobacteria bacterium]